MFLEVLQGTSHDFTYCQLHGKHNQMNFNHSRTSFIYSLASYYITPKELSHFWCQHIQHVIVYWISSHDHTVDQTNPHKPVQLWKNHILKKRETLGWSVPYGIGVRTQIKLQYCCAYEVTAAPCRTHSSRKATCDAFATKPTSLHLPTYVQKAASKTTNVNFQCYSQTTNVVRGRNLLTRVTNPDFNPINTISACL